MERDSILNELIEIGLNEKIRCFRTAFFEEIRKKLKELTTAGVSKETMIRNLFDFIEKWETETYFTLYR